MTEMLDLDQSGRYPTHTPMLPFDPKHVDRCGLRMTRAQFARFLEVSKQAVSNWVREGKITLGADGMLDPRLAVGQLIRNSDPARVRSRVLEPLTRDVGSLQREIQRLTLELRRAREDCEFHEGASIELIVLVDNIRAQLDMEWIELRKLPAHRALAAFHAWLDEVSERFDANLMILDFLPSHDVAAPGNQKEGEGGV